MAAIMKTNLSIIVALIVGMAAADAFAVPVKYRFRNEQMDKSHLLWQAWFVVDHAKGVDILAGEIIYDDVDTGWSGQSTDVYGRFFHEVDWRINTDDLNLVHTSGVKKEGYQAKVTIMGPTVKPVFRQSDPDINVGFNEDRREISAGDANFDHQFNSSDLVQVFQRGHYERFLEAAQWMDGDWNYDSQFNSSDLVFAMQTGKYEQPNPIRPVPEPNAILLFSLGLVTLCRRHLPGARTYASALRDID
ncbi:MAG: hypothetical protein CMJ77_21125 [Planctomycetaceae bacterium]|nr:hypothetical protein [Planctomycetaceae bacterium]